jgi:hypothetical protein
LNHRQFNAFGRLGFPGSGFLGRLGLGFLGFCFFLGFGFFGGGFFRFGLGGRHVGFGKLENLLDFQLNRVFVGFLIL